MRWIPIVLLVACTGGSNGKVPSDGATSKPGTTTPTTPSTGPYVVAMLHGGGSEDDAIYTRFVEAAGNGHIVTLGAREASDPNLLWFDDYWVGLGATSAETVNTETAQDVSPALAAAFDSADGIYIRGGDQSDYVEFWADTPLEQALRDAVARGAIIGGSSAGCAILGGRIYDARRAGIYSIEALEESDHEFLTFSDPLMPDLLPSVITDTHFTERGRLGRLASFVATWREDGAGAETLGIGVDPETALFVWSDGTAEVMGDGSVTLLESGSATFDLPSGAPPDVRGLRMWQLTEGYVADLSVPTEPVIERPSHVSPTKGANAVGTWPDLTLQRPIDGQLGSWTIPELDSDDLAFYYGELTLEAADDTVPGALIVPDMFDNLDYVENHHGGALWFLAQHPDHVVVGFETYSPVTLSSDGLTTTEHAVVIDGRTATHAGVDTGSLWSTGAVEGATLNLVGAGETWSTAGSR